MRAPTATTQDGPQPGALAGALRRSLAALLLAALAAGVATFAVLSLLTPKYAARAELEIRSGEVSQAEPRRDFRTPGAAAAHMHREAIASHVRALMSADLAIKLAASLDLAARPEFNAALVPPGPIGRFLRAIGLAGPRPAESEQDRVLDAYYEALRISQVDGTPAIAIEFRSADPQLAADAANKLVELYRDDLAVRAVLETLDGRSRLAAPVEVKTLALAKPPADKVWPQVGLMTLLAMTASLLLGSALVLARELLAPPQAPSQQAGAASAQAPARLPPAETARTMPAVARLLASRASGRLGFRTMVAGEAPGSNAGVLAVELVRALARNKRQVILLDWSLDGVGMAQALGVSPRLGITDVLSGRATFEDVVERLTGSAAHVIAAGSSAAGAAAAKDRDRVNMLLDALDETYEHVVITGTHEAVRDLFTTIEGRIDAGVVIAAAEGAPAQGSFLGFDVADLQVIRYEPAAQHRQGARLLTLRSALI